MKARNVMQSTLQTIGVIVGVIGILATSAAVASGRASQGQIQFPVKARQLDPINGVGYMQTDVTILSSGQLTAATHTWSAKDLQGFHGAVAVAVLDQSQKLIWISNTQNYGVDGKHVPFGGPSDRNDNWSDTVPAQVLTHMHYVAIKQRWNPRPATPDDIGHWLQGIGSGVAHELQTILQAVGNIIKDDDGAVFPPEPSCTPGPNHVYVVTLGDSVMWGQGLPYTTKFRSQVTAWLQSQLGASRQVCQVPTRAHSGAQMQVSAQEGDTETGLPGEIPSGHPSIRHELQLTVRDMQEAHIDPNAVRLVLMDGGINDVGVASILSPAKSSSDIEQLTRQSMRVMDPLLREVLSTFPYAALVVTGYFPIASENSDVTALLAFAGAVAGGPIAGPLGGAIGGTLGVADTPKLVDNSRIFVATVHQQIAQIIDALPAPHRSRVTLAVPGFQSINAYGGRDTFLWKIEEFAGPEAAGFADVDPRSPDTPNGVAWARARACTEANRPSPKCLNASMGHPNLKGAYAYTVAILEAIRKPPMWTLIVH
jgi:hypothetical protein